MKWGLWVAAAVILIAAAGGTWFAFQSPQFVAGLVALAGGAIWKALTALAQAQIAHDMASPEVDARTKANAKLPSGPPKTGVTTGKTITQPAKTKPRP